MGLFSDPSQFLTGRVAPGADFRAAFEAAARREGIRPVRVERRYSVFEEEVRGHRYPVAVGWNGQVFTTCRAVVPARNGLDWRAINRSIAPHWIEPCEPALGFHPLLLCARYAVPELGSAQLLLVTEAATAAGVDQAFQTKGFPRHS